MKNVLISLLSISLFFGCRESVKDGQQSNVPEANNTASTPVPKSSSLDEELICVEIIDSVRAYYLTWREFSSYELTLRCNNDSILEGPYRIDSLLGFEGVSPQYFRFNLQFLDEHFGFIYGHSMQYGDYPFLLKTVNGGESFTRVLFEENKVGVPLLESSFFMFNQQQGIAITNWADESNFHYQLTNDGGESWEEIVIELGTEGIRILNFDGMMDALFSTNGSVTVIITNEAHGKNKDDKLVILRSVNFGKTFEVL
jgi:hypothetical protein